MVLPNGTTGAASVADDALRGETEAAVLEVADLSFAYGAVPTLFGINLALQAQEMVALVGPNGAGKSTLLSLLCGLSQPSSGSILIEGEEMAGSDARAYVRAKVGMIPDNKAVFPDMTVAENLEMSAYTLSKADVEARTEHAISVFPRLGERLKQRAGTMSGGERQMLSLARALMLEPRLLLVDELTLGLAPIVVDGLLDAVRALNSSGTTVLLVEQSLNVAASVCERALFLDKGEIVYAGLTRELIEHPELTRAVLFGGHVGEKV